MTPLRPILRLLRWLADTLPLRSNRAVAAAWQEGYFACLRVRKGSGGRFTKISTT